MHSICWLVLLLSLVAQSRAEWEWNEQSRSWELRAEDAAVAPTTTQPPTKAPTEPTTESPTESPTAPTTTQPPTKVPTEPPTKVPTEPTTTESPIEPTTKSLNASEIVTCLSNGNGMSVKLRDEDYTAYPNRKQLQVGNCTFKEDGTIEADWKECGLKKVIKDETIIYSSTITNVPSSAIITRDPLVRVEIECTFCCTIVNKPSSSNFKAHVHEITGSLSVHSPEHNYQLAMEVVNEDLTEPKAGQVVSAEIGKSVNVKITIAGAPANVKVRAEKCWTTPTSGTNGKDLEYILLDNSCPVDNTVSEQPLDSGSNQLLTFKSFVYTHDRLSGIEVHCNLVACMKSDECGACVKGVSRRRRALAHARVVKRGTAQAKINVV